MAVVQPSMPEPVDRTAMLHEWTRLTFIHWRFPKQVVERVVPPQLEVETFDGTAWVGLIPFRMRVRSAGGRAMPWVSSFPETNVRTYVRGPDGKSGIWFMSLDAARLGAVLVARSRYRLPYMWSRMQVDQSAARVRYECRRIWPGPGWAKSVVEAEPGPLLQSSELTELDHFLTARWRLYARARRGLVVARAEHAAWPLQRARLLRLEDQLVRAAGLPAPEGDPLVHFSPGVEVKVGRAERLP